MTTDGAGTAWLAAWAKTGRDDGATVTHWLPLHQHLADAAGVADRLVSEWLSPRVVARMAEDLGGDASTVRAAARWSAAIHDVGKLSPAFAVQAPEPADAMRDHGLDASAGLANDRHLARHEIVGQVAVKSWLAAEGVSRTAALQFSGVVGAHHGVPPDPGQLAFVCDAGQLSGTGVWGTARSAALDWAAGLVGGSEALLPVVTPRISRPTQVLLSAIVIMADWIASNPELFPLDPIHTVREAPRRPDPALSAARLERGWSRLELPARWSPRAVADPRRAFADRFERDLASMRPVQLAAVEAAQTQPTPGLVVVEAPMGEGKTEAALLAAEVLAARSGADGCFVALPTRATSDAMFSRVLGWMRRVPGIPDDVSVMLAHGSASLNDEYRGLLRAGYLRSIGVDGGEDEAGIAHQWLRGRRKGSLSQFVVGTVDQILFAGLKSRHLMLRHLALAGKVVVIDEVHSYDVYMSEFLDCVLHWLGAYGAPVILLSATLPPARRADLIAAYESGRGEPSTSVADQPGYPVVLATGSEPRPVRAGRDVQRVVLERQDDDLDTLVDTLRSSLTAGGCAVVVRNTVGRVQETADRLLLEFDDEEVTVAHSRFLACDRARLDAHLLRRFGPPGESTERPVRHVVVASQVIEQSLDVDFDLMITDLAPVDLVLQRMGRLHRHRRVRPSDLDEPRCVLVGTEDWAAAPVRAVRGSRTVYGEHVLLRAAALLGDRDTVDLPDDIPTLVRAGYGAGTLGPPSWHDAMRRAADAHQVSERRRRERAGAFRLGDVGGPGSTLDGWVRGGVGDADDPRSPLVRTGQVRDGADALQVLVVERDVEGGLTTPSWIDMSPGVPLPTDDTMAPDLARVVASCALRLPVSMSQMGAVGDGVIDALERNRFSSFAQAPLLADELVLVLDPDRSVELREGAAGFRLTYDPRRGLTVERL